jgi:hypothetical protein
MTSETVPAFVCVYGRSGSGKTTDAGYSFPKGLFLAAPGALKPLPALCGYAPAQMEVRTMDEATAAITSARQQGGYDSVIVDDFSFLAEMTFAAYERSYTGYKLFGQLRNAVLAFRNAARFAGLHVVVNCWERSPKLRDDGYRVRGGPDLTGKLPEQLPAMCDLVLRADTDPRRKGWQGIYRVNGGADYVGKDRDNGTPSPAPMNLGEILRHNGYSVGRLPALEWQEDMVEKIAAALVEGDAKDDVETLEKVYASLLASSIDFRHARWTVRDGWDRAQLRRASAERHATFFGPRATNPLGI